MATNISFVETSQVTWFIQLRWMAAGISLLTVFVSWIFFPQFIHPLPLSLALLVLIALNIGYSWLLMRLNLPTAFPVTKQIEVKNVLRLQILGDLFVLFILLLFSGGLQNPLVYLFLLHVVIASILFPKEESWRYVLVAAFFPWILFFLARENWTPTQLDFLDNHFSIVGESCRLIVFLVLAGGIWLIVSRLAEELRGAERREKNLDESFYKVKNDLTRLEGHRTMLLANLAKELSQPIKAIVERFNEIEKSVSGGDQGKALTVLHQFENDLVGLKDISGDLQWLSEPHWPKSVYRKEKVDLMVLAAKEVSKQAVFAMDKNLRIKLTGPKRLLVEVDRSAFQQVLSQLLSNSIKYSNPGSGDIILALAREVPFAFFSVSDQGIGISDNDKKNLFQEFFRSSSAEQSAVSGSGLGLYIVKQIIDWHRGMIKVEGVLGEGTKVKVWMPLEQHNQ